MSVKEVVNGIEVTVSSVLEKFRIVIQQFLQHLSFLVNVPSLICNFYIFGKFSKFLTVMNPRVKQIKFSRLRLTIL